MMRESDRAVQAPPVVRFPCCNALTLVEHGQAVAEGRCSTETLIACLAAEPPLLCPTCHQAVVIL